MRGPEIFLQGGFFLGKKWGEEERGMETEREKKNLGNRGTYFLQPLSIVRCGPCINKNGF